MKIIYVNTFSLYNRNIPMYDPGTDSFFLFGLGSAFTKEFFNLNYDITCEIWRSDYRIEELMIKEIDGIVCRIFPSKRYGLYSEFSKSMYNQITSLDKNTIVHFMGCHSIPYHLLAIGARHNKLVATHLGDANPRWKYQETKSKKSYLFYLYEKFFLNRIFNHIISISIPEVTYFRKIKMPVSHIPILGINPLFTILPKEECRLHLGLPLDKKIILQVGRATENRGFDAIIRMFDQHKNDEGILFVFAAINPEDEFYNELKSRNINPISEAPQTVLQTYYSAADVLIFLLPEKREILFGGTGYVPLEALACGTPIVATTMNHFPDPDIHKVARIPSREEEYWPMVLDILNSNTSRELCREIVLRHFSWSNVIKQHYTIYKSLENQSDDVDRC